MSSATPATIVTALPKLVPSSLNWTVPVGVPPTPVTVAVRVTESPYVVDALDVVTATLVPVSIVQV